MTERRARSSPFATTLAVWLIVFAAACGADHGGGGDADHGAATAATGHDGDPSHDEGGAVEHGAHDSMASGELQRYPLKGVVLAVDPTKPGLIVRHEDIEGFMGGMTMNFSVDDPAVLERFEGNEMIEATLVYDGENGWLEDIEIVEPDEATGRE